MEQLADLEKQIRVLREQNFDTSIVEQQLSALVQRLNSVNQVLEESAGSKILKG